MNVVSKIFWPIATVSNEGGWGALACPYVLCILIRTLVIHSSDIGLPCLGLSTVI